MKQTAEQLLEQAVKCEQIAKDCGPLDPAYVYFRRQSEHWFSEALAAEKGVI